jgi:parvulin-like peptidyl-prolyl isomerase
MNTLRIALLGSAFLLAGPCAHAESRTYSVPVHVNGQPIVDSEVREAVQAQEHFIRMQIPDANEAEARILAVRTSALYALMERQLVLSDFEQRGGSLNPQYVEDDIDSLIREKFGGDRAKFLRELTAAGMTLQGYREQRRKVLLVTHLSRQKTKNLPPPAPAQVETYYRDHAEQFRGKDFIKLSTITIPKVSMDAPGASPESQRKLAEDIRTKVMRGASFGEMAKTWSADIYAAAGGNRGIQERTDMRPDIAAAAFALQPNGISNVIDVTTGYMILKCEAKQLGEQVPLEKVRRQVEERVSQEMRRRVVNSWVLGLASRAVIQPEHVRSDFLRWLGNQGRVAD